MEDQRKSNKVTWTPTPKGSFAIKLKSLLDIMNPQSLNAENGVNDNCFNFQSTETFYPLLPPPKRFLHRYLLLRGLRYPIPIGCLRGNRTIDREAARKVGWTARFDDPLMMGPTDIRTAHLSALA